MLTARGWQEWVVHVSAYCLVGNLVQQMDFTVLWRWQLDLWAKELLFEKVPRRESRFLPWGVSSNCRNAIHMNWTHGGFADQFAQNAGSRVVSLHLSEKCWCLCGLCSQVRIFCTGRPESWAGGLRTGRVVVDEGGRVSSRYPMSGAAALHRVLSQNIHWLFLLLFWGTEDFRPKCRFPTLFKVNSSIRRGLLKLTCDREVHQQHLSDVFFQDLHYT